MKTGIASYTAGFLPALRDQAEVVLWTDQTEWDRQLERYAEVRRYCPEQVPWHEVNRAVDD